jgi:hypothetical protein
VGGLKIERGYYTGALCRESIFPLDEQLRLRDKHRSGRVAKHAVNYGRKLSYEEDFYHPA